MVWSLTYINIHLWTFQNQVVLVAFVSLEPAAISFSSIQPDEFTGPRWRDEQIIEQANCCPTMYLGFPNKQQQGVWLFFLRWDISDNDFQKNKVIFPFVHFTNMNSSPTEVAHIQIPNVRENGKQNTSNHQSKKRKIFLFFLNRSQRLSPSFGRLCQPRCQGQKERQEIQRRSTQSDCLLSFLPCTSTFLHLCRRWRRMWGWKRELTEVDVLIYDNNSGIVNSSFYQRL